MEGTCSKCRKNPWTLKISKRRAKLEPSHVRLGSARASWREEEEGRVRLDESCGCWRVWKEEVRFVEDWNENKYRFPLRPTLLILSALSTTKFLVLYTQHHWIW